MEEKDLQELIKRGESEYTEFKTSVGPQAGETLCAFANTHGGLLVIGIDDHARIVGIGRGEEEKLISVAQTCEPRVKVVVKTEIAEEKPILIVTVKKSDMLHFFKGRAYNRVGSTNRILQPQELAEAFRSRELLAFDNLKNEKASPGNIDWSFVDKKIRELEEGGQRIKTGKKELLGNLGCLREDIPTNAGLLLFGKDPQKFFPFVYITVVKYPEKEIGEYYEDFREFDGNLFAQIDAASQYLESQNSRLGVVTEKPTRREVWKYPPYALRELLINAVVHRDYFLPDRIIIKIYPDRMEYHSPGSLPRGVTVANILTKHKTRNPILFSVLHRWRYIEGIGDGINRVVSAIKTHPLKPREPEFQESEDEFNVILHGSEARSLAEYELLSQLKTNQAAVYKILSKNPDMKMAAIVNASGLSKDTIYRALKVLISNGRVIYTGVGKARRYMIKEI